MGRIVRSDDIPDDEIHFKHPVTGELLGKIVGVGTPNERLIK